MYSNAHSQKAGFARVRNADESWVKIDYGDGVMVVRQAERFGSVAKLSAGRFENTTPTEVALAYDYRTNSLRGNPQTAEYHNTHIRPLMTGMPALGSDVSWSVALSAEKLGVGAAQSGDFPMEVKRTYITHAGTRYVILEYSVPEFTYGNAFGEKVTHRARSVALADTGMGQIFWNASLQTANATEKSGSQRPYRYARTGFAMDAKGEPLLDLDQIPEMKRFMEEFYGTSATAPLPIAALGMPDRLPLEMAARIDIAGFTLGENGANQLGEILGAGADRTAATRGSTPTGQGQWVGSNVVDNLLNFLVIPGPSLVSATAQFSTALNDVTTRTSQLRNQIRRPL